MIFHPSFLISRVEKFATGPTTSTLVNLAMCDPSLFKPIGKYYTVSSTSDSKPNPTLFYTMGVVSHSDLITGSNSHQICIIPSDLTWNRSATVLGSLFGQKKIALGVFHDGISFSTLKRTEKSSAGAGLSRLGMSTTPSSSSRGSTTSNAPLPYNQASKSVSLDIKPCFNMPFPVPTFDGRQPFKLSHFKILPLLHSELTIGSAILVAFSLGAYTLPDGAAIEAGATLGVSLNVQATILLADPHPLLPDPADTSLTSNTPLYLGVLSETESSD